MTPGCAFLATMRQITELAATLPPSALVEVSWREASPDLMLVLAQQDGAELTDDSVTWNCGNLTIHASHAPESRKPPKPPKLTLVRL